MTPRLLTVTSGLRWSLMLSVSQSVSSRKLKRRTLYGQLFEQYRVPTQRLYVMSFRPSELCAVAPTGQTYSHGAFSHCMQGKGSKYISGASIPPWKYVSIRIQCMMRPRSTWSLPTIATLFSDVHATTHALHPTHLFKSIDSPHA